MEDWHEKYKRPKPSCFILDEGIITVVPEPELVYDGFELNFTGMTGYEVLQKIMKKTEDIIEEIPTIEKIIELELEIKRLNDFIAKSVFL